jgi:hypothetical protein
VVVMSLFQGTPSDHVDPAQAFTFLQWLESRSPYALAIVLFLWLLWWIPKWVASGFARYDATLARIDSARDFTKAVHENMLEEFRKQQRETLDAGNARTERVVAEFGNQSEKDRSTCMAANDRTFEALTGRFDRLEDKIERRVT